MEKIKESMNHGLKTSTMVSGRCLTRTGEGINLYASRKKMAKVNSYATLHQRRYLDASKSPNRFIQHFDGSTQYTFAFPSPISWRFVSTLW
jgi:2-hydroxychromene-2-carboxylate isomerase